MASSSSASKNNCHADGTKFIKLILDKVSNLHQQLSAVLYSHVGHREQRRGKLELLCRELANIKSAFQKLDSLGGHLGERLSQLENCIRDVIEQGQRAPESELVSTGDGEFKNKIHSLTSSITDLKVLLPGVSGVTSPPIAYKETDSGVHVHNVLFAQNVGDRYSSRFTHLIRDLDERAKKLLLYFAAFPHGTIINKRVLKNWWIAEELYQLPAVEAENKADRVLEDLVSRCLIQAVSKQRRLVGFKMPHRWIHFELVSYAQKERFFAFDSTVNPTVQPLTSSKGCLTKTKDGKSSLNLLNDNYQTEDLEKLRTVFNISEQYPHFKEEFFSKAKDIRVLSLGKWQEFFPKAEDIGDSTPVKLQGSGDCHIEVESTEFLKAPKSLKDLRFCSLRGVSRVFKLPDALCKLSSLMILDLNACYNLEELPEEIGLLKRLIYLDISECYLLERMPKGLASLTELRVLKGFLIVDTAYRSPSCNFKDLSGLKKLIKLGVSSNRRDFPADDDLDTLQKFSLLEKLTISWGGKSIKQEDQDVEAKNATNPETEVRPQEDSSPSSPKLELQPRESNSLSNIGEPSSAEPRKISDDTNPPDMKDNQEGTSSAAEPELRGVGNLDDVGNVAEKKTGAGNAGEIVEEAEPTREVPGNAEVSTIVVNAGNTLERKDSALKPEPVKQGVNTGGDARQGQRKETKRKPRRSLSLLKGMRSEGAGKTEDNIFPRLEKLNLRCYPKGEVPDWLKPENMKKLRKLYIVGGKLHTLNKVEGNRTWTVEILRLKYLEKLETSWEDLRAMFPQLIYLEKVQHHVLRTFKHDPNGEWV